MAENIKSTQRRFEVMGEDIFKIVNKLLGDQTLLKLVKYTDSDPLSHPDVPQDEIDKMLHKNILITPKIPDEDQDKNCYVIVLLDNYIVDPQNEDFKKATVRFDVLCPMDRWVINAKSLRPYLIMNEIDKNFNEKKLAGIGNLSFEKAERLVVSPYLAGYSLKYGHSEFN